MKNRIQKEPKKESAVLFTLNDWTVNDHDRLYSSQSIVKAKVVWLEYNKFLEYMSLETKDRVKYLIENGHIEY